MGIARLISDFGRFLRKKCAFGCVSYVKFRINQVIQAKKNGCERAFEVQNQPESASKFSFDT